MADGALVDDGLWETIEPLPPERAGQLTGRPRVSDRVASTAIVFVLCTESHGGSFRARSAARA